MISSACSSALAASLSAAATTFTPSSGPGAVRRPISSATMPVSTSPSPEMLSPNEPVSMEFQPSSLPCRHQSRSKPVPLSPSSRTRDSGICFSRKSLVVVRYSF